MFAGVNPFEWIDARRGPVYRVAPGRRTLCFEHAGESWFLKRHNGVATAVGTLA